MIRAVLLDFDGVIIDSMSWHVRSWQEAWATMDVPIDPLDILLLEGMPGPDIVNAIATSRGLEMTPRQSEDMLNLKRRIYTDSAKLERYPGVFELLWHLRDRGLLVGMVTGSAMDLVDLGIGQEGKRQFDAIVTGDDVANGKPAPDPYLRGAAELGVSPERCLVVENAPLGIQAARAAGMRVVAVASTLDEDHLRDADRVFVSLEALRHSVGELLDGRVPGNRTGREVV